MKILILEDDFSLALDIEMHLKSFGYSDIETLDSGRLALQYLENNEVDLLIMDVHLNDDLSGIDVANKIHNKSIPKVFITVSKDDKVFQEVMLTNPNGFLIKPFDRVTLQSCIDRLLNLKEKHESSNPKSVVLEDSFFVKQNDTLKRIEFEDILWIEADGNYIELHLDKKRYVTKMSLTKVEQKMNVAYFVRVHKKFLVNIKKVDHILSGSKLDVNGRVIPIGLKFKANFFNKIDAVDY